MAVKHLITTCHFSTKCSFKMCVTVAADSDWSQNITLVDSIGLPIPIIGPWSAIRVIHILIKRPLFSITFYESVMGIFRIKKTWAYAQEIPAMLIVYVPSRKSACKVKLTDRMKVWTALIYLPNVIYMYMTTCIIDWMPPLLCYNKQYTRPGGEFRTSKYFTCTCT